MTLNQVLDLLRDLRVVTADLLDTIPGNKVRHQKFSRFLVRPALPTPRADRRPVQILQRPNVCIEGSVKCARITVADRPILAKGNSEANITDQMNDCLLTAWWQSRLALIDCKQHRGTWTKIKWHKLANKTIVTTRHGNLREPSLFNVVITNDSGISLRHNRVRVQSALVQNTRQILHISNVVNENLRWL